MASSSFGGWLKQSTAVTVQLGPFVDATDGFTPETALTITQAEAKISKNGGTFAAKNEATSLTADVGGMYKCLFDATDTNTLGLLQGLMQDTAVAHRPFITNWVVVPANVWDSLFGADYLQVDLTQIVGVAVNTALAQLGVNTVSLTAGAITAAAIATGAVDADALATDAVTEIVDAVETRLGGAVDGGSVVAGAASTVTLRAGASATNDKYKAVLVRSSAGVLQFAYISGYVGATKVATIVGTWPTANPDNTYSYIAFGN